MSGDRHAPDYTPMEHGHMARALELAARGAFTCAPNPQVGCVLVRDDQIIGEGWHARAGEAHAEIAALADCGGSARGATAFVTLEPCAHHGRTGPCAEALLKAGVTEVIAACEDPDQRVSGAGLQLLRAAGIRSRCGLMSDTAQALNAGYFKRLTTGLPFVRVKLAASIDGATALANGQSKWITDEAARQDGHRLRARSCAVITGSGTVLADDPQMTARLDAAIAVRQPLPVVLDARLRCPASARIFAQSALLFTAPGQQFTGPAHVQVEQLEPVNNGAGGQLNLRAVLRHLAAAQINEVLVEAGPRLSGAFVRDGLIDELIVYQAPKLMGAAARGMLDLGVIEDMQDVIELELSDVCRIGNGQKMIFSHRQS